MMFSLWLHAFLGYCSHIDYIIHYGQLDYDIIGQFESLNRRALKCRSRCWVFTCVNNWFFLIWVYKSWCNFCFRCTNSCDLLSSLETYIVWNKKFFEKPPCNSTLIWRFGGLTQQLRINECHSPFFWQFWVLLLQIVVAQYPYT